MLSTIARFLINKNTTPYLLLLLIVMSGYWWVFIYSAQYDFLDCWLPWRHYVAKAFSNGIFPLWNPYIQLGYPIFADLQGPLLSVENFVVANLFTFNLTTLQVILLGYIYFGAAGMYALGNYLFKHKNAALIIASSYALSGIIMYHTQHFFSVVSFSCAPLTLCAFLKFLENPRWKYILLLVVLFHVQFTTGNQTFNILNFHIIAILLIRKFYLLCTTKNKVQLKKISVRAFYLLLGTLVITLPVLVGYYQTHNEVSRYSGLTYVKSFGGPMTLAGLLSFINPLIASQPREFLGADQSMVNYFFGIVVLMCAILNLMYVQHKFKWTLLTIAVVMFFISMGNSTPIYKLFFDTDPLLRLFRGPAYYMFYVTFILLLFAGYFITELFSNPKLLKPLLVSLSALTVLLGIVVVYLGFNKGHVVYDLRTNNVFGAFKNIALNQTYTIALFCAATLTTIIAILWFTKKQFVNLFTVVLILESIVMCNVMNFQVASGNTTQAINTFLANVPQTFATSANIVTPNDSLAHKLPRGIWLNYHAFVNVVSPDYFNSFYTNNICNLDSTPALLATTYKQPFVSASTPTIVNNISITPNKIAFNCTNKNAAIITVKQLPSPLWKLYVDDKLQPFITNNLLRFNVNNGVHTVNIYYQNNSIRILFWLSYVLVFGALLTFIYLHFTRYISSVINTIVLSIGIIPVILFLMR